MISLYNLLHLLDAGHEFLEFELHPSGKLQYSNDSGYRRDVNLDQRHHRSSSSHSGSSSNSKFQQKIFKEVTVSPAVVEEIRRIVLESHITSVDDSSWEQMKDKSMRRQELEIKIGNEHLAFTCPEILSMVDVQKSSDPVGLKLFYYLAQDLKCIVFSLISLHFKIKPFSSK